MPHEQTFASWVEERVTLGEDFVLGVDISTRNGDWKHDDYAIEDPEARFAARQIVYCLYVLEAVRRA